MRKIDPELHKQLKNLVNSMGYELVGYELLMQGRRSLFRVYIDTLKIDDKKGITVEDCSKVSHQVSAWLDVEDPIKGQYTLEISSPGIDRPLFELEHFQRFLGSKVKVRLYEPYQLRRQYKGILMRVVKDDIFLAVEGMDEEIKLPFSAIEKANLIGEVTIK